MGIAAMGAQANAAPPQAMRRTQPMIAKCPVTRPVTRPITRPPAADAQAAGSLLLGHSRVMVARYLHAKSPRHARGAFTGAHAAYPGYIRLAAGGTLLLDEMGGMAPQAQARLLRFLETGEVFSVAARRLDRAEAR